MNTIPKLEPQHGLIYCWKHDSNPKVVKIGKSTVGNFHNSVVIASKRWLLTPPEFLGFQILATDDEARKQEDKLHHRFGTVENTEFVSLSGDVVSWIEKECIHIPLEHFQSVTRDAWKNRNRERRKDAEFKSKQREYKSNQSQRQQKKQKGELARKEAALEAAKAVIADLEQDTTDE